tara:strand:+ start:663 stop:959 length:297 start_codon:yes stop_codon:yes gene_type:complete
MAGKKYPDYFYENAPVWVERLEAGKLVARPRIIKQGNASVKAYCGSCKHLTETKKFIGEPYCSLHDAAVRGHWSCPKWKFGGKDGPQYVSIKDVGKEA